MTNFSADSQLKNKFKGSDINNSVVGPRFGGLTDFEFLWLFFFFQFWPFAWDKQAPFTLKYALFCCTGFSWPYFVVYYHMVLKGKVTPTYAMKMTR